MMMERRIERDTLSPWSGLRSISDRPIWRSRGGGRTAHVRRYAPFAIVGRSRVYFTGLEELATGDSR